LSKVITPVKPPHPKIRRASERITFCKCLIYGDSGVGKTYLGATAPDALIVLTEPAVADTTLNRVRMDLGIDPGVWELGDGDDLTAVVDYISKGDHPYKTLVIDSYTDVFRRALRKILNDAVSKRSSHDEFVPEQGDWFRVAEKMRMEIRMLRDLPIDVVLIMLAFDIRGESKRVPYIQPKNLALEMPQYFNMVGYLGAVTEGGERIRKLLVSPTDDRQAKNPGGMLPDIIDNPNLSEIFKLIKHEEEENIA